MFPLIKDLPQLVKTLIFSIILVPIMGMAIPFLHKNFWLVKKIFKFKL